jgi:hypothetical protein
MLVPIGCGFFRTLPDSAQEIALCSWFSMGDNKLGISISGFESLEGIAEHYIGGTISLTGVVLNPSQPLAA